MDRQTSSERKYNIHPDLDFDLGNVISSHDLTGFIPAAVCSHDEEVNYSELYEYQAQDITIFKEENK